MKTKKITNKLLRLGALALLTLNSFQATSQMTLKLDPARSNGFTTWEDNIVSATLYIYEKVGSTYNLISQETTTRGFIRIDPDYFNTPNYYYKITGTLANSSTVNTGYVPAVPVGGTGGYFEHGIQACNGKSYAYELAAFGSTSTSNIRLKAQDTDNYYNTDNLVWLPYFQAIDQTTWNAMPFDYPYKTDLYHKYPIASYIDSANFFDKNGVPVTNGWLVEKKFDQFYFFNSASTVTTASFPYYSSPVFTGSGSSWLGFFNSYVDPVSFNGIPDTTVFSTTIPSGLECVTSYSLPDAPLDPGSNWNDWAIAYEESVRELEEAISTGGGTLATADLEDLIHTIYIDDNEDVYTTGITFKKYKADPFINLIKNVNQLDVYSVGSVIPAGLYEVTVFSNVGKILPLYLDVSYAIPFSPLKDYAKILITPNPVIANDLTVNIKNKKTGTVTVKLYDTYNRLLDTDSFNMTEKEVNKHYDISDYTLPSDQIIVKVIFADNSYLSAIGVN